MGLVLLSTMPVVDAQCGGIAVDIDFSSITNPAVQMEWRDANGATYTGSSIPAGVTDSTGGAFPRGSVRWKSIGYFQDTSFDVLVTVVNTPSNYADTAVHLLVGSSA
ncbi:hypothetical protein AB1Y20_007563 [Prymnesium parvum]|uniref:Uncharacterized protein n=1 Tax=Prymnesium parvum TaxID=97485 RepID=A0AB34IWF5_PRYPA